MDLLWTSVSNYFAALRVLLLPLLHVGALSYAAA